LKISLVTSNQGKLREFRSVLEPYGVEVEHSDAECDEIQADTLREVVLSCLQQLEAKGLHDFVIDDSGLFVHGLRDFPGVYSAYALKTIGLDGLLRLLDGVKDRSAHFECCVGASIGGEEFVVTGRCDGSIAMRPSGSGGFGFDPLFVPSGYSQTFAEISIGEKNRISHRGKAVQAFSDELRRRLNEAQR
jgi:XTP/dITP diphosphohydrolase